jgi:hypothetical protein
MDTSNQLVSFIGSRNESCVLSKPPHLGSFYEAIIPHRLGDEGIGCLYGIKNTSFISRRFLRDKIYWKPCGTISRDRPIMLRDMDTPHQKNITSKNNSN